jgi:hypothetical protein
MAPLGPSGQSNRSQGREWHYRGLSRPTGAGIHLYLLAVALASGPPNARSPSYFDTVNVALPEGCRPPPGGGCAVPDTFRSPTVPEK